MKRKQKSKYNNNRAGSEENYEFTSKTSIEDIAKLFKSAFCAGV